MKDFQDFLNKSNDISKESALSIDESLISKLEKITKSTLKDGRNNWFGYPVDLDADEDPSEGGLTVDAVDKAAKVGVVKQLKSNGFKITNAKGNSFIITEGFRAANYTATFEKSTFTGGYLPKVVRSDNVKDIMYISGTSYKNSKDAIEHATIYLDAYEMGGDRKADRESWNFMRNNQNKIIKEDVGVTTVKSFEQFINEYKDQYGISSLPVKEYVKGSKTEDVLKNAAKFFLGGDRLGGAVFFQDGENKIHVIFVGTGTKTSTAKSHYDLMANRSSKQLQNTQSGRVMTIVKDVIGAVSYNSQGEVLDTYKTVPPKVSNKYTLK